MSELLSFFGVIALWIGVSLAVWWGHQRIEGAGERRRIALARLAQGKVAEAEAVFDQIRGGPPVAAKPAEATRATHALLRRIQEHGAFFDDVNALRPRTLRVIGEPCEPLAEILHVRRDLWAASEIVLVEDFRALGPDFAESEYERLRAEAMRLLFRGAASASGEEDLIHLRLALALKEAGQFVADVEQAIRLRREHERLPTATEVIAYPVAAVRALPRQIRAARDQAGAFGAQASALATSIRQSQTMTRGLSELARAREELPQRVVAGLDKASVTARQGAASVKGHYEFLVAAYDFQTKYAELVRRAPEVTERGRQFIARLELAEKSERLKLTSATLREALRRLLMRGLAHAIAGLQRLQMALEAQHAAAKAAAPAHGAADRATARPVMRPPMPTAAAPAKKSAPATAAVKAASETAAAVPASPPRPAAIKPDLAKKAAARPEQKPDPKEKPAATTKTAAEAAKPSPTPRPAQKKPVAADLGSAPAKPANASPPTPKTQAEAKAAISAAPAKTEPPQPAKTSRRSWQWGSRRPDARTEAAAPTSTTSRAAAQQPAANAVPQPAAQRPAAAPTPAAPVAEPAPAKASRSRWQWGSRRPAPRTEAAAPTATTPPVAAAAVPPPAAQRPAPAPTLAAPIAEPAPAKASRSSWPRGSRRPDAKTAAPALAAASPPPAAQQPIAASLTTAIQPPVTEAGRPAVEVATPVAEPAPAKASRSRWPWGSRRPDAKTAAPALAAASPPSTVQQLAAASSAATRPSAPETGRPAAKAAAAQPPAAEASRPAAEAPAPAIAAPDPVPLAQAAPTPVVATPDPAPLAQAAAAPAHAPPSQAAAAPAAPRSSLAAKLTGIDPVDLAADDADNAEDAAPSQTETEDDDPGELTRSILEAQAKQAAKPGRAPSRAFPWLRR